MKAWWFITAALSMQALHMQGQQDAAALRDSKIAQAMELLSESQETEDLDFTTLLDDLNYYYDHPLNLNFASREDLARLIVLNDIQIQNILAHVQKTGKFASVYELQSVEELDPETVRALLPFVKTGDTKDRRTFNPQDIWKEAKSEAFLRHQRVLEQMEGYSPVGPTTLEDSPNSRYLGSADKLLFRYRLKYYDNLSLGFTAEKDAGEEFFRGSQPRGFDFYSAHLYLGNYGKLKHLVLGDYQVQFGQGLTYWSGLAFGKSGNVASAVRTPRELSPQVSAEENNFMRGAGATFDLGKVEATAFWSRKRVDANVSETDTVMEELEDGTVPANPSFSSLQTSGFHRTPGELADKDAILETNAGGHLRYVSHQLEVGATAIFTRYGGEYNRNTSFYNQFENFRNMQFNMGADYKYYFRNLLLFGEAGRGSNGSLAFLQGALVAIAPGFDLAFLYRDYPKDYTSLRSKAFAESSRNVNERGLFSGFSSKLGKRWYLNGYYDLFRFPWLRFRVDAPSFGHGYLAQLEYRASKVFSAYGRFRTETKHLNHAPDQAALNQVLPQQKAWYRLHLDYSISEAVTLRTRTEWTHVRQMDGTTDAGFLFYQDLNVKSMEFPLSFNLRYALFETDSYDARIYAYENDLLYSFSVPALNGKGSRFYLVVKYRINRHVDVSARISQTYYAHAEENGSSLYTVKGPHRTEVKSQIRMRF